ncbi:MAG: TlpA family protein disulfide reductase [Anaerolineae bacterium]|nr:MAG: TlpA family protein disulfide reductase [Anaerolineae bacterium]
MQPFRRFFSIGVLLLGLLWIGLSADRSGSATAGAIPAPQKGFLAPDFTLPTLDGGEIRLAGQRGQVILLNLWASWCGPCQAEMPAMQRVYEAYREQGFTVLAVNATSQDHLADVQAFVARHGLTFPILLDARGEVSRLYNLRSLPTSFFIGRDGMIREVVIGGPMSEALLRTRVEELLKEAP